MLVVLLFIFSSVISPLRDVAGHAAGLFPYGGRELACMRGGLDGVGQRGGIGVVKGRAGADSSGLG